MNAKPLIGITPLWDTGKKSLWMLPRYFDAVEAAGGLPLILPFTPHLEDVEQMAQLCDGFLFTGGHDIAPQLYEEEPTGQCGPLAPHRDELEGELFHRAVFALDKPVLGICRGLQLINVLMGGALYQDIPTQWELGTRLDHQQQKPYDAPSHSVTLAKDSPLYTLVGEGTLRVNSMHHQGIRRLAEGLSPMAYAEDGLLEAVWMPDRRFVWGVQWHPEYLSDETSSLLFRELVRQAKAYVKRPQGASL